MTKKLVIRPQAVIDEALYIAMDMWPSGPGIRKPSNRGASFGGGRLRLRDG